MTAPRGKLVRDRIPEILTAAGIPCDVQRLDDAEFGRKLDEKLAEELAEYHESGEIEELADMVEVIEAILKRRGIDWGRFGELRLKKRDERGGFEKRLLFRAP